MIRRLATAAAVLLTLSGCAIHKHETLHVVRPIDPDKFDCTAPSKPLKSRLESHARLRRGDDQPPPTSAARILIYLSSAHFMDVEDSVIAIRDASGDWLVSEVSESRPAAMPPPPGAIGPAPPIVYRRSAIISGDRARRLDAIVADPILYREPASCSARSLGVGFTVTTLEIYTARRSRIAQYAAFPPGLSGEVVNTLLESLQGADITETRGQSAEANQPRQ